MNDRPVRERTPLRIFASTYDAGPVWSGRETAVFVAMRVMGERRAPGNRDPFELRNALFTAVDYAGGHGGKLGII